MIPAILFWLSVAFIFYVYAGYPILVTLLARIFPHTYHPGWKSPAADTAADEKSVTLLIAAYNEQAEIGKKLENSLALDYPPDKLQILVAADGSNDRTAEIVQSYASRGVELNYIPARRGKMAAINRALPLARHDIIVLSDANNMYDQHALCELAVPFGDPSVGAVSGAKVVWSGDSVLGESEGLYWKYESFIKEQETRLGCCTGVSGEILAVRRDLFEPGPENALVDDLVIAMRLIRRGYRVVYTPSARSYEHISLSARDEMERRSRIGAGLFQSMTMAELLPFNRMMILWQVLSHKFMRAFLPLGMIGAFLASCLSLVWPAPDGANAFLRLAPPYNWAIFVLQVLFYVYAWIGNKIDQKNKVGKFFYLPTFLVNSNLATLNGLRMFLTRRQSVLWKRVARREDISNPGKEEHS